MHPVTWGPASGALGSWGLEPPPNRALHPTPARGRDPPHLQREEWSHRTCPIAPSLIGADHREPGETPMLSFLASPTPSPQIHQNWSIPHFAQRAVEKPIRGSGVGPPAQVLDRRARDHTCKWPPSRPGPGSTQQNQGPGQDGGDDRSGRAPSWPSSLLARGVSPWNPGPAHSTRLLVSRNGDRPFGVIGERSRAGDRNSVGRVPWRRW